MNSVRIQQHLKKTLIPLDGLVVSLLTFFIVWLLLGRSDSILFGMVAGALAAIGYSRLKSGSDGFALLHAVYWNSPHFVCRLRAAPESCERILEN